MEAKVMDEIQMEGYRRDGDSWIGSESRLFDNGKVRFTYHIVLTAFEHQTDVLGEYSTLYQSVLVVDDSCIHERYKDGYYYPHRFGFILKECEKKGRLSRENLCAVLNSSLKVSVERKIKADGYQKIFGILNGTDFSDC